MNRIAIIGVGSRGLGVLEQITSLCLEHTTAKLEIYLVDPGEYGQGTHHAEQQHYVLSNTVASQVTMFSDETVTGDGSMRRGPSLLEWARAEGYRNFNGQYCRPTAPDEGCEILETDYFPRALLGEYLSWVYDHLVKTLPPGIHLRRHKGTAVDMMLHENGEVWITLDTGHRFAVHYVFLATGHGRNFPDALETNLQRFVQESAVRNPYIGYWRTPYPLKRLKVISPDATVAIQGLGLSGHDVISELTVGRGGRFVQEEDRLHYVCSGREPKLLLFSRNSIPFCGRAINQKKRGKQYQPHFFTRTAIDNLRREAMVIKGHTQINFEQDLWPLLIRELSYVYQCTQSGYWEAPGQFTVSEETRHAINDILYPLAGHNFDALSDFTEFIGQYLERDTEQAEGGNVENPVKATTDVLRDVRSVLRYAVDFSGFTPESHKQFLEKYCPIIARVAIGPPKERNKELLALLHAGVVSWAGGPGAKIECSHAKAAFVIRGQFATQVECRTADVFIKARIENFYPEQDDSVLMKNMLKRGIVRPFLNGNYHPGGIDITKDQNLISAMGQVIRNIWALGNIVEGPNFYTHVLPQPYVNSSVVRDAGRCVLDMFDHLQTTVFSAPKAFTDVHDHMQK